MFKLPPNEISQQMIDEIREVEKRANESVCLPQEQSKPRLELMACPVRLSNPIISIFDIWEHVKTCPGFVTYEEGVDFGFKEVARGVCFIGKFNLYEEINQYGVLYRTERFSLRHTKALESQELYLSGDDIASEINTFISKINSFYEKIPYSSVVKIIALLQQIHHVKLGIGDRYMDHLPPRFVHKSSIESHVSASSQCLPQDLLKRCDYAEVLFDLLNQLFEPFNVPNNGWRQSWMENTRNGWNKHVFSSEVD